MFDLDSVMSSSARRFAARAVDGRGGVQGGRFELFDHSLDAKRACGLGAFGGRPFDDGRIHGCQDDRQERDMGRRTERGGMNTRSFRARRERPVPKQRRRQLRRLDRLRLANTLEAVWLRGRLRHPAAVDPPQPLPDRHVCRRCLDHRRGRRRDRLGR